MARSLVGCRLLVDPGTEDEVVAELVEVEAYLGRDDPASHAFRGATPRSAIMFGPPGRLYVYLSYGLHHCANVVVGPEGRAGAVLLRSAAVLAGEAAVRARRQAPRARPVATSALLSGPGNLCRGLAVTLADNGADLLAGGDRVRVLPRRRVPPLTALPRVGITAAVDWPLRYVWTGHPAVSAPARRRVGRPEDARRSEPRS